MEEIALLLVAGFLFGGKKSASTDTPPKDDASKLPPTPSSPYWSGKIGPINFTARRERGAWQSWVAGGETKNHATAYLAVAAAIKGAATKATSTSAIAINADPFVFEGIATRAPGVVDHWNWHVRVPEGGTSTLDGNNDAIAEGGASGQADAIDVLLAWLRPVTEGKPAGQ